MMAAQTSRTRARTPRSYRQQARALQARATADGILRATLALIRTAPVLADITLDDIARESGLAARTILRRFGSRDGVFEATFVTLRPALESLRVQTPPGDIDAAVSALVAQYEEMGDFNIRALEQESQLPLLHRSLSDARVYHREWLKRIFAPNLARLSPARRERRLTALYAATDVYLWKLLRRDLHVDRRDTEATFRQLVRGVLALESPTPQGEK